VVDTTITKCSSDTVSSTTVGEAGAPEDRIEITPEMIEAGAATLLDGSELTHEWNSGVAEYYAKRVLRAALRRVVASREWLELKVA
jgi:hypothetical protein